MKKIEWLLKKGVAIVMVFNIMISGIPTFADDENKEGESRSFENWRNSDWASSWNWNSSVETPTANKSSLYEIATTHSKKEFHKDGLITREELFVMLHEMLVGFDESDATLDPKAIDAVNAIQTRFKDANQLSLWAMKPIYAMMTAGVINENEGALLNPKGYITSEEAVAYIQVAYDYMGERAKASRDLSSNLWQYNTTSRGGYRNDREFLTPEQLMVKLGNNSVKYALVFGSAEAPKYATAEIAKAAMTMVTVDVWVLTASGSKVPGKRSVMVNKAIAETVKQIFKEIYEGPEKYPIKDIGGYSWRQSPTSEHRWGLAIDINANENYMIRKDGTIVAGSFWKPGENPFSIKPYGDVVTAFKKYGFSWGGDAWSMSNDYMHFSFLGE